MYQWQHALIASGTNASTPAFQLKGSQAPLAAALIICPFSSGASVTSTMTFTLEQAMDPGKDVASANFCGITEEDMSALWTTGAVLRGVFPMNPLLGLDQLRVVASSISIIPRSVAMILKF